MKPRHRKTPKLPAPRENPAGHRHLQLPENESVPAGTPASQGSRGHQRSHPVSLERKDGRVEAKIEDNGIGFRVEKVLNRPGGSVGLMGIEERAALLGGKSVFKSQPGKGTQIRVELPLPPISG
ncbi:MAG: hypothetical protein PHE84_13625 [bacterium]|nr:hypothetical protein [bacterium]